MATLSPDIFKPTKFGGKYTVTLIPGTSFNFSFSRGGYLRTNQFPAGDGIGAEVTESVKTIFKHENVPVEWDQIDVTGVITGKQHSEDLFKQSVLSLRTNKVGLKGIYIHRTHGYSMTSFSRSVIRYPIYSYCEVWPSVHKRRPSPGT